MSGNWASKWTDFYIRGYTTSNNFDEVDETDLPEMQRMGLAMVLRKLEYFRCPVCRRVGTCEFPRSTIFRDQEINNHINGSRMGEVEIRTTYWIHLWCKAEHEGPNFRSDGSHHRVICLYLGKLGADGCKRGCAEDHIAYRRREAASLRGEESPTE